MHETLTTHFLALVSPSQEVYVISTRSPRFRTVYKDHRDGCNSASSSLFDQSTPALYLLETAALTSAQAFARRILWSRRFHELGYSVVDWEDLMVYVEYSHRNDVAAYAAVQQHNLLELCRPELDLAQNFVFKSPPPRDVRFSVSAGEWHTLQLEATHKGLPLKAYFRDRFYSGTVSTLSLPELRACEQQCRQVLALLERQACLADWQDRHSQDAALLHSAAYDLRKQVGELTNAISRYVKEAHV